MTYTTTPPSEPGLYQIRFDGVSDSAGKLTEEGEWWIIGFKSMLTSQKIVEMGGKFGPRIEPPHDDDEEAATVEYLREQGIGDQSCDPGLWFYVLPPFGVIQLNYTDNSGVAVGLADNPTRRKVRQIVEALR